MSKKSDKNYEFNIRDIELIEKSLHMYMNHLQLNGEPDMPNMCMVY